MYHCMVSLASIKNGLEEYDKKVDLEEMFLSSIF